ncbi:unnamed protein product [Colias eurytheme]|nr:unnamed protein product [Colias eurytheme]
MSNVCITRSLRAVAARAEMGARLVRLAPRAPLLRDLRLPPDTAARAHTQIATELAERAAELCLESAAGEQSTSTLQS